MKKYLLVVVGIAMAIGASSFALSSQELKGPKIEVKELRYDFGRIAQGQKAIHVFEFRNSGDEVLEIRKVETS